MTENDKAELIRLTEILRSIEQDNDLSPDQIEALRKAAYALHLAFIKKLRPNIERFHEGAPLTEEQKARIRSYGFDPDAELGSE